MFLNLDAGELPTELEALWSLFDVLNVACGGHAGDHASMTRIARFCARSDRGHAVALGAHPSYPDLAGIGRRTVAIAPDNLRVSVRDQCAALASTLVGESERRSAAVNSAA